MTAQPTLLNLEDTAARLGVSVSTLRRMITREDIVPSMIGRTYKFPTEEIDRYLAAARGQKRSAK